MSKAGQNGRGHRTPISIIRKHLVAQRGSGLSIKAYCEKSSLSPWTFYGWQKRHGSSLSRVQSGMRFFDVGVVGSGGAPFELIFSHGLRLRLNAGFDRGDLSALLDLVGGREGC